MSKYRYTLIEEDEYCREEIATTIHRRVFTDPLIFGKRHVMEVSILREERKDSIRYYPVQRKIGETLWCHFLDAWGAVPGYEEQKAIAFLEQWPLAKEEKGEE